jgi:cytochrome c oxidase cbb3-type subunit 4
METYSFLRELADSWALLILTLIFLGVIAWAFRPGSRALHDDAAAVPFRDDPTAKGPRDGATK